MSKDLSRRIYLLHRVLKKIFEPKKECSGSKGRFFTGKGEGKSEGIVSSHSGCSSEANTPDYVLPTSQGQHGLGGQWVYFCCYCWFLIIILIFSSRRRTFSKLYALNKVSRHFRECIEFSHYWAQQYIIL